MVFQMIHVSELFQQVLHETSLYGFIWKIMNPDLVVFRQQIDFKEG